MPKRRTFNADEVERVVIQARTTVALRAKLEAAADAAGRSMAQEFELRLERSFDGDAIQKAIAAALAEDRRRREAEHEERCFGPRAEAIGRQYRY